MATGVYKKFRFSDFSLEGATEEITSDVLLPDSRLPSKGDPGMESSNGELPTEFFADEADEFIRAVLLDDKDSSNGDYERLMELGSKQRYFTFIKAYYQGSKPVYQVFTGVQVGQMQATFDLKSKVKLSFTLNGCDNNDILREGDEGYDEVKDICDNATEFKRNGELTKSYNTLKGSIRVFKDGEIDDKFSALVRSFTFTVNQNPDSTGALFQMKAIDNALGDENIDGTLEVWNTQDNKVVDLRNKAKDWVDDVAVEVVLRPRKNDQEDKEGDVKYKITLNVSLKTPTESKDGNKLAFSIPFQVFKNNGLKVEKEVVSANVVTHSITYNLDGGTNSLSNPSVFTAGDLPIALEDAEKDDHTFDGWFTDSGFTDHVTEIAVGTSADVTLYAKFTAI